MREFSAWSIYVPQTGNDGQFFIQNLGFNASIRETATVILKVKSNILTSTPYNFINVCNAMSTNATFNSLTWIVDNDWSAKTVQEKQLALQAISKINSGAQGGGGDTSTVGGGGSHTHSISGSATSSAVTLNVLYQNHILCSKN